VAIEEGVTIIGPAVLGAGTQILRGATVAQSALAADSIVSAESVVRQRVVVDRCTQDQLDSTAQDCSPVASVLPSSRAGSSEPVGASVWSPRVRRVNLALKRAMDIVLSAAALLALWPLLVLVAIIVKLDSRGPVLFAHHREGRRGRDFPCWKFRTMVAHANQIQRQLYKHNEVDGPQFKMKNDPRITRVGRWLRGTNIDELPQLFNVLLGHMSLVGPRPSPFRENQICVPWRRARLSVRPGITGLWQVCRDEDRLKGDFHEWIFYDMTYVRHLSVWLDIKILLATLFTLGGRWSVPLAWVLSGAAPARDQHPYSVSAA
jgi:lipopolysaccharide/colanic/teichoic acid biosynthesis glycosyltransferase